MSFIKYLSESITSKHLLIEKKDHLIKRIPSLTDEEKKQVIDLFNKKPHLENKIDWNDLKNLTFDDFKPLFDVESKTGLTNKVRELGIGGLRKGKDYIPFPISKGEAYIPLTHEASKHIASSRIGSCEGEWCTAENDPLNWKNYTYKRNIILIYIILDDTKYAVAVYPDNGTIEIFDEVNRSPEEIPNINIREELRKNRSVIDAARKYIDENASVYEKYGIENYKENPDGSLYVNGYIKLDNKGLTKLPIKFDVVEDAFYCYANQLTSLEGAPKYVGGTFNCASNQLTSLEGAPKEVGKSFYCNSNYLTTLKGAPEKVNGNFVCATNRLTSLEGAPKYVEGNFNCNNNKLTSLEGAPEKVDGDFYCYGNPIKFTEEDVRAVSDVVGKIFVYNQSIWEINELH